MAIIKLKRLLPEDAVDDAFGKIPLASDTELDDYLVDAVNTAIKEYLKTKGEPLTSTEYKILNAVSKWIEGFRQEMTQAAKVLMKYQSLLQQAKGKFPEVFKPAISNGTIIYRGVASNSNWLKKVLNTKKSDWVSIHLFGETYYRTENSITYDPTTALQSWSAKEQTAKSFAGIQSAELRGKAGELFLLSKLNDEFIFNEQFLNAVLKVVATTISNVGEESEVIHFGNVYAEPVYVVVNEAIYNRIPD